MKWASEKKDDDDNWGGRWAFCRNGTKIPIVDEKKKIAGDNWVVVEMASDWEEIN
jgi:hypothetical protein